ncbi:MAG TPA: DNA polymerase domain-containing protein [Anaerolineaceae bacterium]|nr:DNA polymerase domain-containing protein [Anaerolineaceae bacterium]
MSGQTFRGWLLDLYLNQQEGLTLWFISETDDCRQCFTQAFPVAFYAAGPRAELRRLWHRLRKESCVSALERQLKQDVFVAEPVEVLRVDVDTPARQVALFRQLEEEFQELTWYDADVTISTRYISRYGAFPLALCELSADTQNRIQSIQVLNSRWDLMPALPPLRVMELAPDADPAHGTVRALNLRSDRFCQTLPLNPDGAFLSILNAALLDYDPDILVTDWGDSWLLPFLLKQMEENEIPLALNRNASRPVRWQKEITYFSYGHIIYRPEEAHLFGRCHIDRKSAMMWSDYSLAGTLEMARVTTLPIEKAARVSPGQGISAMQVITALEKDILVPYQKRQVEEFKSGMQLIQADRGGMIYQPKLGLHSDVGEVDFVSMYPAVIIRGNISPEVPLPDVLTPASEELGVVPLTLKPIYEKRVALKTKTRSYPPDHPMAKTLKARSSALKWLLVVCFGFLGYKNARYGRIEAHEAVTKGGREVLLRAKEVAEEEGFEVLQMYVDALWLKKKGCSKPEHFEEVMRKIVDRTGLAIALDGVLRWVAFLPSKTDARVPIANRYFGIFQSGEIKVRGLEARRRDTPRWIGQVQMDMITCLGQAKTRADLPDALRSALRVYQDALEALKAGRVPLDLLVVNGKVSYALDAYKSTTASVRAARQLESAGMQIRPGQRVRFLFTQGEPDVRAWELAGKPDPQCVNIHKYMELLAKAGGSVLLPFGIDPGVLMEWTLKGGVQLPLAVQFDELLTGR